VWFSEGRYGTGPLSVPMPAKASAAPAPKPAYNYEDPYSGDPVGKGLGLPPKMTAPAVTIP
jgi:hypothetical protein